MEVDPDAWRFDVGRQLRCLIQRDVFLVRFELTSQCHYLDRQDVTKHDTVQDIKHQPTFSGFKE